MKRRHFHNRPLDCGIAILLALFLGHGARSHAEETWIRHAIDPADPLAHRTGADGAKTGDLDGDGRLDLVTGWEEGGKVRVALHPGPEKVRDPWPTLTVGKVRSPEDAILADLDGDGRPDVVSACEGKERRLYLHWAPPAPASVTDESAWITRSFDHPSLQQWWMQLLARDLDRDGDLDLIAASKNAGGSVTWLENPGPSEARDPASWTSHRLAEAGWIMSLAVLQSGPREFLVYSDRKGDRSGIWLAPFLPAAPWIGPPVRIAAAGEEVMFLDLADLTGDGRPEIVAALRPATIALFESGEDPLAPWTSLPSLPPLPWNHFGTVKAVAVAPGGDPRSPRFAITCENAIEGRCGLLLADRSGGWIPIGGSEGVKFDRVEWIDLDADGDPDLVTCEERDGLGVVWYENRGGGG